ncbi:hypothetical protein ARAM_005290 [Aspergillus rambellii]|uniref:J domain-containing protein n=1 Tax=Aspergillus rambellii TaxID=308745 RepID=A0A0F8UCN4_9EURO|nr:hypothetical protein ARAM_005290 [Aspergillus rambellii]
MSAASNPNPMNCYEILRIPPNATLKDINSAYKRLALKHHPDKTGGDDTITEFQKIQQAVEILRDHSRRQKHDEELARHGGRLYTGSSAAAGERQSQSRPMFSSGYAGWRPQGTWRSRFHSAYSEKYMYSYRHSVHMDPYSKESQEEMARCAKEREMDERIRRNMEAFAEDLVKETEREWGREEKMNMGGGSEGFEEVDEVCDLFEKNVQEEEEEEEEDPFDDHWFVTEENAGEEVAEENTEIDIEDEAEVDIDIDGKVPDAYTDSKHDPDIWAGPGAEADADAQAGVNANVDDYPGNLNETEEQSNTEYMTASPGILSDSHWDDDIASDSFSEANQAPGKAEAYFTNEPGSENDLELTNRDEADIFSSEEISASEEPTSQTVPDTRNRSETHVSSHLAPFIPFFTTKLAHASGRYTQEDLHTELKGMVMETFCGWLESLRITIPGASPRETNQSPHECLHRGFWIKELDCDECEACHMWMPLYTLVCPGCGIKKCVGCKFSGEE